jgi:hypothetical protein
MVLGDAEEIGAPRWLSSVGSGVKTIGGVAAKGAAGATASAIGQKLLAAGASATPAPPPPKSEGIPKGVLIAGSVIVGVGLLALLASGRKRPQVANPRRRRRRRR